MAADRSTLRDVYRQIRAWYRENAGLLERDTLKDFPTAGQSKVLRADDRERASQLTRNLPDGEVASDTEMRAVLNEVRTGLLEWAYGAPNGDSRNGDLAIRALEESGGRQLSDDEWRELASRPLRPFLMRPLDATAPKQAAPPGDSASDPGWTPSASDSAVVPFDLAPYELSSGARPILEGAALMAREASDEPVSTTRVLFEISLRGQPRGDAPWVADFLRQAVVEEAFTQAIAEAARRYGGRDEKRSQALFMTAGLRYALERAEAIAQLTTGGRRTIHGRHLLAALIVTPPAPHRLGAARRLEESGIDVPYLRQRLFEWLKGYGDDDDAWRTILLDTNSPVPRLTKFHADDTRGRDLLGIGQEVVALATLIAARAVVPPLSIGLFGDWGAGKTFFMRELRRAVGRLSDDARATPVMQRDLPFYKHIVQIEFNAWHYVEGNLWASLVEHIFDHLHLPDETRPNAIQAMQEHWITKLGFAETARTEAEQRQARAADRAGQAQQALEAAKAEHQQKQEELKALTAENAGRYFKVSGAYEAIKNAVAPLNLIPFSGSVTDLESSLREARAIIERGSMIFTPLLRAPDRSARWRWLLIILLAGPVAAVLVGAALSWLGQERIAQLTGWATGAAAILTMGAKWLQRQARWVAERLDAVQQAQRKYDQELAGASADTARKLAQAKQEVMATETAYTEAQRLAARAQLEVEQARSALTQATSARLLARFIEDRASSGDYRKHLGLLALVRDDLEKLSDLIEAENWRLSSDGAGDPHFPAHHGKFATLEEENRDAAVRVNRIVLYIDDLDRCPPAKVVEVLQAVHLLLAFPLFVVVVGVDARWVSRSLETRYRELLHTSDAKDGRDVERMFGVASSQDYLEKIFQIPLWLRPMDANDVRRMIQGMRPGQAAGRPAPAGSDGPLAGAQQAVDAQGTQKASGSLGDSPGPSISWAPRLEGNRAQQHEQRAAVEATDVAPNVESLEILDVELTMINELSPLLGRSPRALKRFVNVYRLIKAGMSSDEYRVFMRPNERSLAQFEQVLFLLAIDSGLPALAPVVFDVLVRSLEHEQLALHTVDQLIERLGKHQSARPGWANLNAWLLERQGWPRFANSLGRTGTWVPRVSRFSFRAAPHAESVTFQS